MQHCASCHGASLGGGFAPAITGEKFRAKWQALGAAALGDYIAKTMPPANPGGLSAQDYAQVTTYILSMNGIPAASPSRTRELPATSSGSTAGFVDTSQNRDTAYRKEIQRRTDLLGAVRRVTEEMLRRPPPEDWLNWRNADNGFGFSRLDQINRGNVRQLQLAWSLSLSPGTNQITPIAHDGILFVNSNGVVQAVDTPSGDVLWTFARKAAVTLLGPPVSQPRNMAIADDRLYVPTIDNHIIALDFRTGAVVWDHLVEESGGVLRLTGGPIVVREKVLQGVAGCAGASWPGGCYIVALDAATGKELWRFNTLQRPGAADDSWNGAPSGKRFGGSVWTAGTYDAELNLVYFGVGQTYHIAPLLRPRGTGSNRALYTDSTLALDPDTGKLVWHYQHLARDVWDYDWAFERMVIPLRTAGGTIKAIATIGKLGILDVLDARSGRYLSSYDLGVQNLVTRIDPKTGRKTTDPAFEPGSRERKIVCPFPTGVRNFPATAYDPTRGLLYSHANDTCGMYSWKPGSDWDIAFDLLPRPDGDGNIGQLVAIDVAAGKTAWTQRRRAPQSSAVLATAGGLIFAGARDRWFSASDSDTGGILWKLRLNDVPNGYPIAFARDGVQYIAITTGGGGPTDSTLQPLTPELPGASGSVTLWVFRLPPP